MEEKRIELDKEIALFMGWRIDNSFPDKNKVWRSPKGDIELESTFKFSSDWKVLMEVFEAINEIDGHYVEITDGDCIIYKRGRVCSCTGVDGFSTMEAVYNCFSYFAMAYNKEHLNK